VAARLQARAWPPGVEVEDYSFGAIDAVHRLRDASYERAIFFGAIDRGDPPGTVRRYRWVERPDGATVQEHVAQAAQAVISLETTLIVAGYFAALPEDTLVVEVEPEDVSFGDAFSPPVAGAAARLEDLLVQEVAALA